jgi:uncharacterized membrane protein YgcG
MVPYYGRGSASRMSRTSPAFLEIKHKKVRPTPTEEDLVQLRPESSTPSLRTYITPSRGESNSRSYTPSSSSSSSRSGSYGGGGGAEDHLRWRKRREEVNHH